MDRKGTDDLIFEGLAADRLRLFERPVAADAPVLDDLEPVFLLPRRDGHVTEVSLEEAHRLAALDLPEPDKAQ